MKTFFKKFAVFVALIIATIATVNLTNGESASAAPTYNEFLGMPSWSYGVDLEAINSTNTLTQNIVLIVSNILTALTVAASYLVLGYTIYGGYLYIFSNGDPGKAASGKKTITRAFIGLAVVGSAYIILNAIRIAFMKDGTFSTACYESETACVTDVDFVKNALQWFIGIAGIVAAIFLVTGGIGYVTSAGDSGKLQKAKSTIIYSLIGLAIVGLAQVAVVFVADIVKNSTTPAAGSTTTSYLSTNQPLLIKEDNEK